MKNIRGVSLIEVMVTVVVTSICLLGLLKLYGTSGRSLTMSMGSLQAAASAEDLLETIQQMRWDRFSTTGVAMDINGANPASVSRDPEDPKVALEDWADFTEPDNTPRGKWGPFQRSVTVEFVELDGANTFVPTGNRTHRKRVTVTTKSASASASISAVFCNLP